MTEKFWAIRAVYTVKHDVHSWRLMFVFCVPYLANSQVHKTGVEIQAWARRRQRRTTTTTTTTATTTRKFSFQISGKFRWRENVRPYRVVKWLGCVQPSQVAIMDGLAPGAVECQRAVLT